jgi:catalase
MTSEQPNPIQTTDAGIPVESDQYSLTVGAGGPILLQDSYSKDGVMRIRNVTDPVYFPNSKGGPQADSEHHQPASWYADGELVRTAYEQHAAGVTEPVLQRAFWYLGNVDKELGERVEKGVRTGQS